MAIPAVLVQLCRTADAHGLALTITALGTDADDDSYKQWLRQWYGRHGFSGAGERLDRHPGPCDRETATPTQNAAAGSQAGARAPGRSRRSSPG